MTDLRLFSALHRTPFVILMLVFHIFVIPVSNSEELPDKDLPERCEVLHRDVVPGLEKVRCRCKNGRVSGTHRGKPACVPAYATKFAQYCDMQPCQPEEDCEVSLDKSGWMCKSEAGTKTVRVINSDDD